MGFLYVYLIVKLKYFLNFAIEQKKNIVFIKNYQYLGRKIIKMSILGVKKL